MKKEESNPKGRVPDFKGTEAHIVDQPEDLIFGATTRVSPYDPLLDELATKAEVWEKGTRSTPRPIICCASVRAKASMYSRSVKLGIRISFAIRGTALYIRYEGRRDSKIQSKRRGNIKDLLKPGVAMTYIQIANKLRDQGDVSLDAASV